MINEEYIECIGIIVGYNLGTIKNVKVSGSIIVTGITKPAHIGGLVGYNCGTIENVYSRGTVEGHSNIGGLVGYNIGTITNSYTISKITAVEINSSGIGGLVGYNLINKGTVTNSYWSKETSGVETSAEGTELTLTQMKTKSSYEGWDFESGTVWVMKEYPELVF